MNIETIKKLLADVFVPRAEGLEGVAFRAEYMDKNNLSSPLDEGKYAIYQAISEAQRESGLTFDFSYDVAKRAVDALLSVEDWDDDEALFEAADRETPIYNAELMEIYQANWWAVDEARADGGQEMDSVRAASVAWNMRIVGMILAIKENLSKLINEEAEKGEKEEVNA